MINMENREKLFKQYKSDCPQTIGETDTAFDNDNFIDWLCQQNKQLLDEIERLKQSNERYQQDYSDLQNRLIKQSEMLKFEHQKNVRLQSELKAADSVNEWISVEDRLPKFKTYYNDNNQLVMETSVECLVFDGNEKFVDYYTSDFGFHKTITHYIVVSNISMPLPNQPK